MDGNSSNGNSVGVLRDRCLLPEHATHTGGSWGLAGGVDSNMAYRFISPSIYKTAIVKPLLKNQDDLKRYRPVSSLSSLSKVAEKLVLSELSECLNANQLFNPVQSAYRPNHSS